MSVDIIPPKKQQSSLDDDDDHRLLVCLCDFTLNVIGEEMRSALLTKSVRLSFHHAQLNILSNQSILPLLLLTSLPPHHLAMLKQACSSSPSNAQ